MSEERESDTDREFGSQPIPDGHSNQNTEEPSAPTGEVGGGSGGHRGGEGDASGSGESGTGDAGRPGGAGEESQATGFPQNAG